MGNISQSVIDEARSLNDAGQVQIAYQVLSRSGDNYSRWAVDIVGESGGLFQRCVRFLWENAFARCLGFFKIAWIHRFDRRRQKHGRCSYMHG